MNDIIDTAQAWVNNDPDPVTRNAGQVLIDQGNIDSLIDHFGSRLRFGTAGMRGPLGPGPNRMNRALVRTVAAGLGSYLKKVDPNATQDGVVVGFDGRHGSQEFAADTAAVLMEMGFRVIAFDTVCATPQLAHAIPFLNAAGGVMVTASHNPPQDNGYKVYWRNGAQIIPPHDRGISNAVDAVNTMPALSSKQPEPVPSTVWSNYLDRVLSLRVRPSTGVRAVYTAMHGVGWAPLQAVMNAAGHTDTHPVKEQQDPDGDFPTVAFPNPEEDGALDLAIAHAQSVGADIIIANDPDADRLAVALPDKTGRWRSLTGNEVGVLLAEELLAYGPAHPTRLVATTIVSTTMLRAIAKSHGALCGETLTGFKWLANLSLAHDGPFVLGFEEALGYSIGGVVNDKDGISAALVLMDLASNLKTEGRTLWDALERLYKRHGVYKTHQIAIKMDGAEGAESIEALMRHLREQPPHELADTEVIRMRDVLSRVDLNCKTCESDEVPLPPSNVLEFTLEDHSRVLARPSGTEPKMKLYIEVVGTSHQDAQRRLDEVVDATTALVQSIL